MERSSWDATDSVIEPLAPMSFPNGLIVPCGRHLPRADTRLVLTLMGEVLRH